MANISSISSSIASSNFARHVQKGVDTAKQTVVDSFPEITVSSEKSIENIKKFGQKISSPEQRVILGATALATQPFIDANNKRVDEKTRKVSVARTIAKILVATTTGYLTRKGCITAIKAWSQKPAKDLPKYKSMFMPNGKDLNIDVNSDAFKQYQNAAGTIAALAVMTVTNFAIDAPLTKKLTNVFINKHEKDDAKALASKPDGGSE
ncbi:MAG: hypothetical protein R3Y28_03520 [Candidatus Gastranaerophilales bacterium]